MTASVITGKGKIGGWLAARHRDAKETEPREEPEYVDFDTEDLIEIQADSRLRQQIIALEKTIKERDEQIVILQALIKQNAQPVVVAKGGYISASAFARKNRCAVSTITRRFAAGKLDGYRDDKGHIFVRADQAFTKYQKRS